VLVTLALVGMVAALLLVAGAHVLGDRVGIAAPLVLVLVGGLVGLVPAVPTITVDPEVILAGILPPLLYSAAVAVPPLALRREVRSIGALSVVLVVLSSVALGAFFSLVVPGLSFAWGIALGAVLSPTDAVATSIVRRFPVSARITTMLDGEGLFNDATALVLLRTAVAAAAGTFSLWGAVGDFVYAVAVAAVLGYVAGRLVVAARARVDVVVSTLLSFTAPFLASLPAEELGASGLVAAVVAGVVTSSRAPRALSPRHRMADTQNWRTVELVLEGAIFLLMGLQLDGLVRDVQADHLGVGPGLLIAAGALVLTVAVRAAYVVPLLLGLARRARRWADQRGRLEEMRDRIDGDGDPPVRRKGFGTGRPLDERELRHLATRVTRGLTHIDYLLAAPLGPREGAVVVWAGMRGAVSLAAAQTLPADAPSRPLLVLVAFAVAAGSLLVQGGTLGRVVRRVRPAAPDPAVEDAERAELVGLLRAAVEDHAVPADHGDAMRAQLRLIAVQRDLLLRARDDGRFSTAVLEAALVDLDATQMALELRASRTG